MQQFHPLLLRQFKRFGIDYQNTSFPPAYESLFKAISKSYLESEEGRYIIDRAMEISSQEMYDLREKLQKEKEIIQSLMTDGLCVFDSFWQIVNLNSTASKLLYSSTSNLINKSFSDFFSLYRIEDNRDILIDLHELKNEIMQQGGYHCEMGKLIVDNIKKSHLISFSINPLPLINNKFFSGAVMVFRDISESIQNQLILKDSLIAAERSNAAKTLFLANMSHEIRTPLNGVLGMLQLLEHTSLNEKQQHYVQKSYECANALLHTLGDILDFSKIESGKIEFEHNEFSLYQEMCSIISIFKPQCSNKNLNLEFKYEHSLPHNVIGDSFRTRQVISNLINNAIKFTPEHGSITLEVTKQNQADNELYICFAVTDTGIGIPIESQTKIFNIFSQADESTTRKFGGTGLGLAIAKQLVEQMDGNIHLKSETGKGSTFYCTIKFQHAIKTVDIPVSVDEQKHVKYNAQVLIVEDNDMNQVVLNEMLGNLGCQSTIVDSGAKALKVLENQRFDVIFMDCHLPEIDGFITTETIREVEKLHENEHGNQIIIALTADTQTGTKEKCLKVGMNDYLTKPVHFAQLQSVLSKYLPLH